MTRGENICLVLDLLYERDLAQLKSFPVYNDYKIQFRRSSFYLKMRLVNWKVRG